MEAITLKGVHKTLKGMPIFQDAYASFEEHQIHGIIGPNGSGKSVLFKMICGFIPPDQGEVSINEKYYDQKTQFPSNFGIIIDRPGYLGRKTGYENLEILARLKNHASEEQIKETMYRVEIEPNIKQKMKNYSLGMKQKIALAQAVMEDQQVLILDEPFNGLDQESVQNVRELLLSLRQSGKTILMTSHNQEDIDQLCDNVYRVNQYRLEAVSV